MLDKAKFLKITSQLIEKSTSWVVKEIKPLLIIGFQFKLKFSMFCILLNLIFFCNKKIELQPEMSSYIVVNQTELSSLGGNPFNWPVLGVSIFCIFGVFGNVLVCLTILRDSSLQTKINYYLFSLAIADLAVCAVVIPMAIIQDFFGKIFGKNIFLSDWILAQNSCCSIVKIEK